MRGGGAGGGKEGNRLKRRIFAWQRVSCQEKNSTKNPPHASPSETSDCITISFWDRFCTTFQCFHWVSRTLWQFVKAPKKLVRGPTPITMQAEIFAKMILFRVAWKSWICNAYFLPKVFWGPQLSEHVRQFSPSWSCPTHNRKLPEYSGCPQ